MVLSVVFLAIFAEDNTSRPSPVHAGCGYSVFSIIIWIFFYRQFLFSIEKHCSIFFIWERPAFFDSIEHLTCLIWQLLLIILYIFRYSFLKR